MMYYYRITVVVVVDITPDGVVVGFGSYGVVGCVRGCCCCCFGCCWCLYYGGIVVVVFGVVVRAAVIVGVGVMIGVAGCVVVAVVG